MRLVIDNVSLKSTKVYLDDRFFGSFQEHFVSRLQGRVFVLNEYNAVALFKNFSLSACNNFNVNGRCTNDDGKKGELHNGIDYFYEVLRISKIW